MKVVLDKELTDVDAKLALEWLRLPAGKVFFDYVKEAANRHHSGTVSILTDNPMKDVLATQREIGAELALVQLMEAVEFELSEHPDS